MSPLAWFMRGVALPLPPDGSSAPSAPRTAGPRTLVGLRNACDVDIDVEDEDARLAVGGRLTWPDALFRPPRKPGGVGMLP